MWTLTTRKQHRRETSQYQSDLTAVEWRVTKPHLPVTKKHGQPRSWTQREIVNGIFYMIRAGCPCRLLPSDLPLWETIYRWFGA